MGKRERENECHVCHHFHSPDVVCGVCGHRLVLAEEKPMQSGSKFPTEILTDFLYLGSYDNASSSELLKAVGISRILNTVPGCQNMFRNSFEYYSLQDDKNLQFDEAIQFLGNCEKEKARVLVYCMTGRNRSAAIVMGYLMKCKGWRLPQSIHWVKGQRPQVELSPAFQEQLIEYEKRIFGPDAAGLIQFPPPVNCVPRHGFGFGFSNSMDTSTVPTFNQGDTRSIFELDVSSNFTFGAGIQGQMDDT